MANPISASTFSVNVTNALSVSITMPDSSTTALNVKNQTNMPPKLNDRDCPVMYPVYNFRTGNKESKSSMGTGGNAFWETAWDAHYFLAYSQIGAGRYGTELNGKVSDACQAILNALSALWDGLGVVRVEAESGEPTVVQGPDEKTLFYGAEITLHIVDWRNAG